MAIVREKKNTNPIARDKAKVGDVRSVTDGTINFWTTQNMARNPIGENPITPADLKGNDKPMSLPEPKTGTAAVGIMGMTEAGTDTYLSDLEAKRKASETEKDTSLADYTASRLGTKGKEEMTSDKYSTEGGVDDLQFRLNKIDNQILNEQESLRRKKEKIDEMGGGLSSGAIAEKENLDRQSARYQADLSLIKSGIQGDYDTAKAIADRAIAVQLEKDQMVNDTLKTIYEDNKADFTLAEQREFSSKQAERERKLNAEEQKLKDIYAVGLDFLKEGGDSATAEEIFKAKSVSEAVSKTGNVLGATARLQRQKLNAEIDKILNPVDTNVLTGKDKFDAQLGLAKSFNDRTGDYKKASTQIDTIRTLSKDAVDRADRGESIAAASQGVITAFNKLLDPTSVVRESEYARSAEGLALINRVEGQYARMTQGGAGITAEDLKEFAETAETLVRGYENTAIDEAQLIIEQASPAGLDVRQIIPSSVLDLMETRFIEALDETAVGETFTIAGRQYKKVDEDNFEPI